MKNYEILEMGEDYAVFEMCADGYDLEVQINITQDEQRYTVMRLNCPTMVMNETNIQRLVRDFKVLGLKAFRLYEERYAISEQTEGDMDD